MTPMLSNHASRAAGARRFRPPRLASRLLPLAFCFSALGLADGAALAQFGADVPVTAGPWSRFCAANNAYCVAADSKQNVHVIYGAFEFNHGYDQEVIPAYRMYDHASDTWGPETRIADPADRVVVWWNIALTVDCNDDVHCVWVQLGESSSVLYRKKHSDGTWDPIEVVRTMPAGLTTPSVAVDKLGNVYVAWAEGYPNTDSNTLYNVLCRVRDRAFEAWDPSIHAMTSYVVGTDASPGALNPAIATQAFNNSRDTAAHIVWADHILGGTAVRWIRRDGSTGIYWDMGGVYTFGVSDFPTPPSAAVHCNQVHIAWTDAGVIEHRVARTDGTPGTLWWDAPAATGISGGNPSLAADGLGNVHMAFNDGRTSHARWSPADAAWVRTGAVDDGVAFTEAASVACDPLGGVHVVWVDYRDASSQDVYYDHGDCMATPAPPDDTPTATASLSQDLRTARASTNPGDLIPVILQMREQADLPALRTRVQHAPGPVRRREVIDACRAVADRTQGSLLSDLASAGWSGDAADIQPLWIVNSVAARVTPAMLDRLAERPDVAIILHSPPVPRIEAPEAWSGRSAARAESALHPAAPPRNRPIPPPPQAPPDPPPPPDIAWGVSWIGAPDVWAQGYKGQCILAAVLDTGIDLDHPDLVNRLWVNAGEIPGNGLDDDANGRVDDVHGYDFANGDGVPQDGQGHGTHVAGTIAGDGTLGTITGAAPEASVMAVRVCDDSGSCSDASIALGIQYALDNGAQVLNLSLGARCASPETRHFFRMSGDVAALTGVTMCVAAGNDECAGPRPNEIATPGDVPPPWIGPGQPALGAVSGVTTIGATAFEEDEAASFSSRGPVDWSLTAAPYGDWRICDPLTPHVGLIKPDVAAPGENILSADLDGDYAAKSGTSMATPHVSGLVALMLSKNHDLTSQDIHRILEQSAMDLGDAGKDNVFGAGRVSALDALDDVVAQGGPTMGLLAHDYLDAPPEGSGDGDGILDAGEDVDLILTLENDGVYMLGAVTARLTADAYVTITKDTARFGNFTVNEIRDNADDPFEVEVAGGAPDGAVVTFTVEISGYGVCETKQFADTIRASCVHVADHDAGGVRFSVTDQGIAGFLSGAQTEGAGFVFPNPGGPQRLFIGSFLAGTDSTYVLNRDYDDDPVKDWEAVDCLTFRSGLPDDPVPADEVGIGIYDDSGHPAPRGLVIEQRSYAWADPPDDDFVIVTYKASNPSPVTLRNLWLGLFMDWDLDATEGYESNRGAVDPARGMVTMWRPGGGDGAYVGMRALSHDHPLQMSLINNPVYIWPQVYLKDADRFHFLSGDAPEYRVTSTPNDDDWSAVIGVAPFTLDPGDSVVVAFAVLAGASLADLETNADAAAARWAAHWGTSTDVLDPALLASGDGVRLDPPWPNPMRGSTRIVFRLARPERVRLELYDIAGRLIAPILEGSYGAGSHAVLWTDPEERRAQGLYVLRLRTQEGLHSRKILVAR